MTSRSLSVLAAFTVGAVLLTGWTSSRAEVGSGRQMTGSFGPPTATTVVRRGPAADDFEVTLRRESGSCSGALSGSARAFTPYVVTLSERDPDSRTTCTVDLVYAPDFASVEVKESAACLTWHGAACDFQGTFKRSRR